MKPSARVQAVIDVWEQIQAAKIPMDLVIGDYMRNRRYIGSKDRSYIAETLYEMMRHYARTGWWLERMKAEDTARNRMMIWLALGEGADEKRILSLFDGSQYSPEPLSDIEQKQLQNATSQSFDHPDMPAEIACECPPLYAEKLKAYFTQDFNTEMKAMLGAATLDLRVNIFLSDRDTVQQLLEKDNVKTEKTPYSPWGLRCQDKAYLARTKAMNKGWIDIQDEGSQLIAHIVDAEPGMQVLDYCAGGGGKTLALGAAMQRKGRIVAMDNDARRLERGRRRYKKAHLADIIEVRPLTEDKHRKWLKKQKGKFDRVLLDVPCTGTGTWRRNPDMRWNTYSPALDELIQIQSEIMDRAVHTVKPGGRMIYATCSLLPDENEMQIEAFLGRHDGFKIWPLEPAKNLGSPYMRLTPSRHNTDGFFAAILEKQ